MGAAKYHWGANPPFIGEVIVIITYLYSYDDGKQLDVDNIPKPILDALNGLIYSDDTQVSDLLCRKRDMNGDLRIPNPSPMLLDSLQGSDQFVHITVDNALNREVTVC